MEEDISKKKTCERLTRHLQKEDLGARIFEMHLTKNRKVFSRSRYLILDGSDLNKPYATTMEGIGRVRDGSTGEIGNGYWLMNMIGVEPDNECLHMLNSRLYSFSEHEEPEISENKVILGMTAQHRKKVSKDQILVIDRGGDRRILIEQFLAWQQQYLYDKGYQIILACSEPLLYRGRISELKGFIYYKLTYAVRLLLLKTSCREMHSIVEKTENQLALKFL